MCVFSLQEVVHTWIYGFLQVVQNDLVLFGSAGIGKTTLSIIILAYIDTCDKLLSLSFRKANSFRYILLRDPVCTAFYDICNLQ